MARELARSSKDANCFIESSTKAQELAGVNETEVKITNAGFPKKSVQTIDSDNSTDMQPECTDWIFTHPLPISAKDAALVYIRVILHGY